VLATQNDGTNNVLWEHRDAGEQSVRQAESSGTVIDAFEETASGAKIEPVDPYPADPSFTGADTDGEYPHLGSVGKPITGCALNGVPLPDCSWIFDRLHPMEFMEWNARSDFLGYSVSTADGPKKFGNNLKRAIGEAYEQGHLTVTANWRINDNWFQGSVSSVQAQNAPNPVTERIHWWDLAKIVSHLKAIAARGRCQEFLTKLLDRAGDTGDDKAVHTNIADLFGDVFLQQGFVTQKEVSGRGFSSVQGAVGAPGGAQVRLSNGSNDFKGKLRIEYFAYDALSELTHVAGSKPSTYATGAFSDYHLAKTALEVANEMKGHGENLTLPTVDPTKDTFGQWSDAYHHILSLYCKRKERF